MTLLERLQHPPTLIVIAWIAVLVLHLGGDAMIPIAVFLIYALVFFQGRERGRKGATTWLRLVPVALMRRMPPLFAAAAALLVVFAQDTTTQPIRAFLAAAVGSAAWLMGHRAGSEGFDPGDYWRDIVSGNLGWLVAAMLWASVIDELRGPLEAIGTFAILTTCLAMALRAEPLFMTGANILAQNIRLRHRALEAKRRSLPDAT